MKLSRDNMIKNGSSFVDIYSFDDIVSRFNPIQLQLDYTVLSYLMRRFGWA